MARRALLWHLFPTYLLVILASLLAVTGFFATSLKSFYRTQVSADLRSRAALLEGQIEANLVQRDDDALQQLCNSLGSSSATRITVVLPSGEVLADSEEKPASMDNHASRPEIKQALAGKTGSSIRFSKTLNQRMMYVAVPLGDLPAIRGILRVALPITAIDDALWSIFVKIIYGSAIVALLAAMASWVVARRITQPLRELRNGAEQFARGELDHQLITDHSQEIDALADAMNKMARELDERMNTVLRQKREQEAVLSSMVEGVLAVDVEGRLISINSAAASLFDVDPDAAIGHNVSEVIRNSSFQDFLTRTLHADEAIAEEITFRFDEKRIYQAHGTVLSNIAGLDMGAVIVLHDVTHVRRLERVRSDFVSNVSHELRTPITSIKGFVETLIENPPTDGEEAKHFLEIIAKNANQLNALISDLLSLSRIEQGEIPADELLQGAVVYEILSQARSVCEPTATRRGITLDVTCDHAMVARAHPSLLQQAVVNLIDNATKYSEPGQEVRVEAVLEAACLTIRVTDNGAGISAEHLPRLFERFYRVDKARSRDLGGTGLGLAIVKHIAELHGGTVQVESTVGTGSRFEIRIPV